MINSLVLEKKVKFQNLENLFILDEDQKIKLVIDRLGLNSISQFDPNKRIIEYMIMDKPEEPLAGSTVRGFIEQIAARKRQAITNSDNRSRFVTTG